MDLSFVCQTLAVLSAIVPPAHGQLINPLESRLYFLAATATWNRTDAFPANLYQIDHGELKLVTQVVPRSEGVQFIRHYDGVLTIGSPHTAVNTLHLIDVRRGQLEISDLPVSFEAPQSTILTEVIVAAPDGNLGQVFEIGRDSGTNRSFMRRLAAVELLSPPQYFPGICILHNLENGKIFTLKTGQADTEILGVIDDTVIYRVNVSFSPANYRIPLSKAVK